ncbi:MAG TPA: tetrathionate reductase family octaheme c-type cytochrome [Phycisphaeraceae bacterium]|nr:tetrathionate reductase family octaheme c-type cytochrome [Phycisphaeraceae bacterium]
MVKRPLFLGSCIVAAVVFFVAYMAVGPAANAQDKNAAGEDKEKTPEVSTEMVPMPEGFDPVELAFTPSQQATADHSKFEVLQQDFPDGPSVTKACLTCHTEAAKQIMKTSHWTWICPRAKKDLGIEDRFAVGKAAHVINNFCIALASNEPRCTSCHAGYGWKDKTFDFTNENLVDCLVCHEQTGKYKKFPTAAGHPVYSKDYPNGREWPPKSGKMWMPVDLKAAAQSVAAPTRRNCGTCHFFGGGGEGVKHGDMDVSLAMPDHSLDVHMDAKGLNFTCQTCHTTNSHVVSGRCYEIPGYDERKFLIRGEKGNLLACEACHGTTPHPKKHFKLNQHTDKVSCEACHIPKMAPAKATKMWWDWSRAGDKENGKGVVKSTKVDTIRGPEEVHTYHFKKGEFIWAANINPEYIWFNDRLKQTYQSDRVDDSTPAKDSPWQPVKGKYDKIDINKPIVWINHSEATYDDVKARIKPVKIHRGIQAYDPVNKTLVVPKLFPGPGPDKGEAYWKIFDWDRSIKAGMAYAGLPYSGEYDWIQTAMIWPLSHMVRPADEAVKCVECHTRSEDGRLHNLNGGFYMPGRDYNRLLDSIGVILIVAAIGLSLIHGVARIVFKAKG